MIRMEIEGGKELLDGVQKITDTTRRKRLMREIAAFGEASTQERFVQQKGPDGRRWVPSIRAREEGGQTLRDKGHLMNSLSHNATPHSAEWGSNRIYAGIHQFGGTIRPKTAKNLIFQIGNRFVSTKKVNIPARPFLGINQDDEREIGEIVSDFIDGAFA